MSSLETRIKDFITVAGTDYKQIKSWMFGTGSLASLATTDKSSLVAAINEALASGGGTGATNLTATLSATSVIINSDTGSDATIPAADTTNAGVMTKAMFDKLATIATSADVTSATNIGSSVHGAANKTAPVGADEIAIMDSAASYSLKRMTATQFATYITGLIVNGAPGTLDQLNELAAALGNDPNYAATITTALANKQPLDTDLSAIAALTSAADKVPYATAAGVWDLFTVTAAARGLLDDADVATMRTTLSVYSQAEIGNPDADLAAYYTAAKA